MKTIIVATDYSEPARNATHYAAALSQSTGAAALVLYHSFHLPVPISDVPTSLPAEAERYHENLLTLEAIKLDLIGTYGIREDGANLLVMVPRRHGFWAIIFNRSTTRKMAYQVPVPLLVLADPAK